MIQIQITDLETGSKAKPVDIDWLLTGEPYDLEFENGDSLPLSDFREYRKEYRIDYLRPVEPAADGGREEMTAASLLNELCDTYDRVKDNTLTFYRESVEIIRRWESVKPVDREASPAPVDPVALLEWFIDNVDFDGAQSKEKRQYWMKDDGNEWAFKKYYTITALIQEFINQKTKEV